MCEPVAVWERAKTAPPRAPSCWSVNASRAPGGRLIPLTYSGGRTTGSLPSVAFMYTTALPAAAERWGRGEGRTSGVQSPCVGQPRYMLQPKPALQLVQQQVGSSSGFAHCGPSRSASRRTRQPWPGSASGWGPPTGRPGPTCSAAGRRQRRTLKFKCLGAVETSQPCHKEQCAGWQAAQTLIHPSSCCRRQQPLAVPRHRLPLRPTPQLNLRLAPPQFRLTSTCHSPGRPGTRAACTARRCRCRWRPRCGWSGRPARSEPPAPAPSAPAAAGCGRWSGRRCRRRPQ